MMGVAMMGHRVWLLWAQDWIMEIFDREAPCARRTLRATAVLVALSLVACRPAFGGIIEDAVKSGLEGMLGYVVARVNAMGDQSLPTSFTNLFNGASGSHLIYAKALELYVGGVAKAIAASLLSLTMLHFTSTVSVTSFTFLSFFAA